MAYVLLGLGVLSVRRSSRESSGRDPSLPPFLQTHLSCGALSCQDSHPFHLESHSSQIAARMLSKQHQAAKLDPKHRLDATSVSSLSSNLVEQLGVSFSEDYCCPACTAKRCHCSRRRDSRMCEDSALPCRRRHLSVSLPSLGNGAGNEAGNEQVTGKVG